MMKKHEQGKNQKNKMIKMFMKLDLSKAQRAEIRAIVQESKKNMPNPRSAFSDTKFDKAAFIKIVQEKKANKIQKKDSFSTRFYHRKFHR